MVPGELDFGPLLSQRMNHYVQQHYLQSLPPAPATAVWQHGSQYHGPPAHPHHHYHHHKQQPLVVPVFLNYYGGGGQQQHPPPPPQTMGSAAHLPALHYMLSDHWPPPAALSANVVLPTTTHKRLPLLLQAPAAHCTERTLPVGGGGIKRYSPEPVGAIDCCSDEDEDAAPARVKKQRREKRSKPSEEEKRARREAKAKLRKELLKKVRDERKTWHDDVYQNFLKTQELPPIREIPPSPQIQEEVVKIEEEEEYDDDDNDNDSIVLIACGEKTPEPPPPEARDDDNSSTEDEEGFPQSDVRSGRPPSPEEGSSHEPVHQVALPPPAVTLIEKTAMVNMNHVSKGRLGGVTFVRHVRDGASVSTLMMTPSKLVQLGSLSAVEAAIGAKIDAMSSGGGGAPSGPSRSFEFFAIPVTTAAAVPKTPTRAYLLSNINDFVWVYRSSCEFAAQLELIAVELPTAYNGEKEDLLRPSHQLSKNLMMPNAEAVSPRDFERLLSERPAFVRTLQVNVDALVGGLIPRSILPADSTVSALYHFTPGYITVAPFRAFLSCIFGDRRHVLGMTSLLSSSSSEDNDPRLPFIVGAGSPEAEDERVVSRYAAVCPIIDDEDMSTAYVNRNMHVIHYCSLSPDGQCFSVPSVAAAASAGGGGTPSIAQKQLAQL